MRIIETPQTMNPCFSQARPMNPVGILVHSTGANNKYVRRYVDAAQELGVNPCGNNWNNPKADKCVHVFIGLDINHQLIVAQTLPYTVASWGCCAGRNGCYNRNPMGHIQFEVCEDGLRDIAYYRTIWQLAENYCVYLCLKYHLSADSIVDHYEAWGRGYASNHEDPPKWMSIHGDSMDAFRARVRARLSKTEQDYGNGNI